MKTKPNRHSIVDMKTRLQKKFTSHLLCVALIGAMTCLTLPGYAQQYWDLNGATPGAGGLSPGGNWLDSNWGSLNGNTATAAYTAGGNVVFSAGTDATGGFNVTNNNGGIPLSVGNITVKEGNVTLVGDAFSVGGKQLVARANTVLQIDAQLSGVGLVFPYGTASLPNNGRTILTASNNLSGTVTLNSSTSSNLNPIVRLRNSYAFGTANINFAQGGDEAARLELEGSGMVIPGNISAKTRRAAGVGYHVVNVSGSNVLNGTISYASGGSRFLAQVQAGKLVFNGDITPNNGNYAFVVDAIGDAEINGAIRQGSGNNFYKVGAGLVVLNGVNNDYLGATYVGAGTLRLGAAASLPFSGQIYVSTGAKFDVSAVSGFTLGGSGVPQGLYGDGTVLGDVTLSFSATNAGATLFSGSVTANAGSSILPGGDLVAGTVIVSNHLTLAGGGYLRFDLTNTITPGSGTNDLIVVGGQLAINGPTTLDVRQLGGTLVSGAYTLFTYESFSGSETYLQTPVSGRLSYTVTNDTAVKAVKLIVSGVSADIVWKGDGSANLWDQAHSQNWLKGAVPDYYFDGDRVTFNNTGSNTPAINLASSLAPGSLVVNATKDYTFSGPGAVVGTTSLVKSNAGTLFLETLNTYVGGTLIWGGTLQLGTPSASGNVGVGPITNYGTLVLDGPSDYTIISSISGTGGLLKSNLSSVTLRGTNAYFGPTVVAEGKIILGSSGNNLGLPFGPGASNVKIIAPGVIDGNAGVGVNSHPTVNGLEGDGTFENTGPAGVGLFLNVGANDTSSVFHGCFRASRAGIMTVVKIGAGTFEMGGNDDNSYASFQVQAGTLVLNKTNAAVSAARGSTCNVNGGLLRLGDQSAGDQLYDFSTPLVVNGGAFDLNGQTETVTSVTVNGGKLQGNGTLTSPVTINAAGAISPGATIGSMTINGDLALAGTAFIEVNKAANTNDIVVGIAQVVYGGALVVSNLSGTPQAGDSFAVFQAGTPSGNFASITPSPGPGLIWNFTPATGVLSVKSLPRFANISLMGGNVTLAGTGGSPGALYYLVGATNLNPPARWLPLLTNTFDVGGNFSNSIPVISGRPAEYFGLQLP